MNSTELEELYQLLTENYVEDAGCTFRFDYSVEFLRWFVLNNSFASKTII